MREVNIMINFNDKKKQEGRFHSSYRSGNSADRSYGTADDAGPLGEGSSRQQLEN